MSKLAQFNLLMCLALVFKLRRLQVSSKAFALYFLKSTHLGICRNGIFCTWARLFVFLASYLGTYCMWLFSYIFKILPNVRSTINQIVKMVIQISKDIDWTLYSKNEMWLPPQCLSICNFFQFHHSNLTSLFGVFNINSLCNAKFTVDVPPIFAFFVLIFMSAHVDMKYCFVVRRI